MAGKAMGEIAGTQVVIGSRYRVKTPLGIDGEGMLSGEVIRVTWVRDYVDEATDLEDGILQVYFFDENYTYSLGGTRYPLTNSFTASPGWELRPVADDG